MSIYLKRYILPALGIVCILTSWQGISTHSGGYQCNDVTCSDGMSIVEPETQIVTATDTGISEIVNPRYTTTGAYLSLLKTDGYSLQETNTPQQWLSARIAEIQAASVPNGHAPVIVAVLDTGVDKHHEDLDGVVIDEVNFTDSPTADDIYGHGTHVTGIIAAANDNGIGIDGVAPDSRLYNVKVADDRGRCRLSALAEGIIWAVDNGAQVINISIEMQESSPILQEAIDYAWESGAIIIAAAGNSGSSLPVYPACYDNCIGVTALKDNGQLAPLANYGDWVDAAAPGFNIYSTLPGDDYGYKYGTSFAAAYVSGLSALLFPLMEDTNGDGRLNDEVRQTILAICGSGIIDNPAR
jgi:subtilisin family serine protease